MSATLAPRTSSAETTLDPVERLATLCDPSTLEPTGS
jgi:hypothetical protein